MPDGRPEPRPSRQGGGGTVRIGLVGCGEVCEHKHLPALRSVRGAVVVALADVDAARCERVGVRYGIPTRFPDAESLCRAGAVDVVGVLTPPGTHLPIVRLALETGHHVLVEKPLALSMDDADALVEAANSHARMTMTNFHMRWHRLIERGRGHITTGALGDLESVRSTWCSPRGDGATSPWKLGRATGGGALVELGVHLFDLWRFLLRTEIAEVFAETRDGRRDDESAVVSARLTNGMLASAVISERSAHEIELEIRGDQQRLRLSCQRFDGFEALATRETSGMLGPRLRGLARTARELPLGVARMRRLGDYGLSYAGAWQHLVDSIRSGTPPQCSFEDGRSALRVVLAAAASASSGERVRVSDAPRALAAVVRDS